MVKPTPLSLRLPADELAPIDQHAESRSMTRTDWLRSAAKAFRGRRPELIDRYCDAYGVDRVAFFDRAVAYEFTRHARDEFTRLADDIEDNFGHDALVLVSGGSVSILNDEGDFGPSGLAANLRSATGSVIHTNGRTVEQICLFLTAPAGPTGGLPCAHVASFDTTIAQPAGEPVRVTIRPRDLPRRVVLADEHGSPLDAFSI